MRVLFVNPSPVRGGAEQMLSIFARDLPAFGVDVQIACLAAGPFTDELSEQGARVELIHAGRMRQVHRWAQAVHDLSMLARHCDVVCSWQVKGHYYGTPAARLAGKPATWWDHGIRPQHSVAASTVPRALRADLVFSSSLVGARRHRNARAIHPGIDVASFGSRLDRERVRRSLRVPEGIPLVGIVGRLQPWKGQHVFLHAAARLPLETRFVVVGDAIGGFSAGYPAALQELARELDIADRVHFAGHRSDVASVLSALDVFVHASTDEPFGIVIVEALASEVAVVATAGGGVGEIIEDDRNGYLVPPGDSVLMAERIRALLEDSALRDRFIRAGKERVVRDFTSHRMVSEFASSLRMFAPAQVGV